MRSALCGQEQSGGTGGSAARVYNGSSGFHRVPAVSTCFGQFPALPRRSASGALRRRRFSGGPGSGSRPGEGTQETTRNSPKLLDPALRCGPS
eukprot:9884217-Alexandrium_andersonii.AAC.1